MNCCFSSFNMCRFLIYKGREPMLLSNLLTKPAHSIINQSFDSRLRIDHQPINGDGFGVGYYTLEDEENEMNSGKVSGPCVYKAITPAWNNLNLQRLAEKTRSRMIFAHVRSSTYGVLSETNCHPFTYHNLMFMHNGGICNFRKIKRRLMSHIEDEFFLTIQGATDSECSFSLFLDTLYKMGYDPKLDRAIPAEIMRLALVKTIQYIKDWVTDLHLEDTDPSLMNFAVTDGESIVVSRYVTSKTDEAASLYFSTGSKFIEVAQGQFKMERLNRSQDIIMVASEPLTFERGDWISMPTNSTLTIRKQIVMLHPIIDEFYQENPTFIRSREFAESKGLMGMIPKEDISDKEVPPLEREGRSRAGLTV
ncbi:glutamine amidotransferase subunit [Brettanomyces nanus]|uniref:Glutamine amidotransferase subunit n=1 Tax=Eeniella nana TaxID=13502 RepID=A0A875RWC0_EENNA|nr:glutamine amidotransferase subunit [Brettanomyces nanus]QPG73136.1 glutamine amidotransferase subunit [Brettanomyces nanus]